MPKRLPLRDIFMVLAKCLGTAARYWLQYTLVALAWLGIIPLTACMYLRFSLFKKFIYLFFKTQTEYIYFYLTIQLMES